MSGKVKSRKKRLGRVYKMPMAGKWVVWNDETYRQLSPSEASDLKQMYFDYQQNPMAYFLPHGIAWSDQKRIIKPGIVELEPAHYPKERLNDGAAFLSDRVSDLQMVTAPNHVGKTTLLVIWAALRLFPTEETWPIFSKEHGVEYYEWEGPKRIVLASYTLDSLITLWDRCLEFWPRNQLRNYLPDWGKFPGETGKIKPLSFGGSQPSRRIILPCGSEVLLLSYSQQQVHWESFSSDRAGFDEQPREDAFWGWHRSTVSQGDYTPCAIAATAHHIPERPDTGAANFIFRDFWYGNDTHGMEVGRYQLNIPTTPDAIVSKKKRKELYDIYENPEIKRSPETEKRAIARYYGGIEHSSGRMFGDFTKDIHVIPRLWKEGETPPTATLRRSFDYATSAGVNCCLWIATIADDTHIVYRAMYKRDYEIPQTVHDIISMSHNRIISEEDLVDEFTGITWPCRREDMCGEYFYETIIDPRAGAKKEMATTVRDLIHKYGLETRPGPTSLNHTMTPQLIELLKVEKDRKHIITGKPGAPKLYFFDDLPGEIFEELESCQVHPDPMKSAYFAAKQTIHAITCLLWFACSNPVYWGKDSQFVERYI